METFLSSEIFLFRSISMVSIYPLHISSTPVDRKWSTMLRKALVALTILSVAAGEWAAPARLSLSSLSGRASLRCPPPFHRPHANCVPLRENSLVKLLERSWCCVFRGGCSLDREQDRRWNLEVVPGRWMARDRQFR